MLKLLSGPAFVCELLQSQNIIPFTHYREYATALYQTAYLSRECRSFNICRISIGIPTTIVVEDVPTTIVFPQSLWEHARSTVKQDPTSIIVAGFPTRLAVAGIPTRRVVAIFPTTSLVGRLPQQGLWDWHTIGNLACET